MNWKLRNLLIALAATSLFACGGEEPGTDEEQIQCGEGTRQFGEECVPDVTCEAGETQIADGRCIRSDYCAAGTRLDQTSGRCRADDQLNCGPNTHEEEGECVPTLIIGCGEGTVAAGAICVPSDGICGDGTATSGQQCRPTEDVCGEGTVYDVNDRRCIRVSNLSCGPGTTAQQGVCVPSITFYQDLAESADLDLNLADAPTAITLKEEGEPFVIVGTINAPEMVDGDLIQDEDQITFQTEPGTWIRVVVYSLGLPEPGFVLESADFMRRSDRGAGIETIRDIAIPSDDTFTLTISNLPQILGSVGPAGGEDWGYVASIEVMSAPDAATFDLNAENFSGNVRNTRDNLYELSGVEPGLALAVQFSALPLTAEGEIQVWNSENELTAVRSLSNVVTFDAPSDPFYVLFDRVHSFGGNTTYTSTSIDVGSSLAAGETWQEEISLDAGEYVGIFQVNLDGSSLRASVRDSNGDALASPGSITTASATSGTLSYYYYSDVAQTVTLQLENTGGELGFFSPSYVTGAADEIDGIDGALVTLDSDVSLSRGQRHYVVLDVTVDELIAMQLDTTDARIGLRQLDGTLLAEGAEFLAHQFSPGTYLLTVEATAPISGFVLTIEETDIFEVDVSNSPNLSIPKSGVFASDTITVPSCPNIIEIELDVNITHWWRGDLKVNLVPPSGGSIRIHDGTGGASDDIIGTYPFPGVTGLEDAAGLLNLEGTNGSGDWKLEVTDVWTTGSVGTLNSWGLFLTCEG